MGSIWSFMPSRFRIMKPLIGAADLRRNTRSVKQENSSWKAVAKDPIAGEKKLDSNSPPPHTESLTLADGLFVSFTLSSNLSTLSSHGTSKTATQLNLDVTIVPFVAVVLDSPCIFLPSLWSSTHLHSEECTKVVEIVSFTMEKEEKLLRVQLSSVSELLQAFVHHIISEGQSSLLLHNATC